MPKNPNSGPDRRFQRPPSETSSGNLSSFLKAIGHRRPEMKPEMDALLVSRASLFKKRDSLNAANEANGELILNKFSKDVRENKMSIAEALDALEKYILEQEKL